MQTITLEEAQSHLAEIIEKLIFGEEVVWRQNGEALAKQVRMERTNWHCQAGSAIDKILWIAPDFDAPLDEFKECREGRSCSTPTRCCGSCKATYR